MLLSVGYIIRYGLALQPQAHFIIDIPGYELGDMANLSLPEPSLIRTCNTSTMHMHTHIYTY